MVKTLVQKKRAEADIGVNQYFNLTKPIPDTRVLGTIVVKIGNTSPVAFDRILQNTNPPYHYFNFAYFSPCFKGADSCGTKAARRQSQSGSCPGQRAIWLTLHSALVRRFIFFNVHPANRSIAKSTCPVLADQVVTGESEHQFKQQKYDQREMWHALDEQADKPACRETQHEDGQAP